jgi:hypothetical protein
VPRFALAKLSQSRYNRRLDFARRHVYIPRDVLNVSTLVCLSTFALTGRGERMRASNAVEREVRHCLRPLRSEQPSRDRTRTLC